METLYPASYLLNSNWFMQESNNSTEWTRDENKRFESALAIFDNDTPDRWIKVASLIPGKSVFDVMKQYKELVADISDIESGLVPIPGYLTSSFTLELVDNGILRRKSRSLDQEKKKGVPWTEDEHRRFLLGLQKHGRGDWRNISRNFVISKTPTQVASHAQKFFLRQHSGGKDKRRPSIHDITTVHLTDSSTTSDDKGSPLLDKSNVKSTSTPAVMVLGSTHRNPFVAYPNEIVSHGLKSYGADIGPYNSSFQIQSRYQVRG